MSKLNIVKEILQFLVQEKKWWLIPLLAILLFMGLLMILVESSSVVPVIYAIF